MAKPTNENKLTARTAPPIVDGVKMAVLEMARRQVFYRGRKIGIEGLVGAVMLGFLKLSKDEQEALLRRLVPEVEGMFGGEDRGEGEAEADRPVIEPEPSVKRPRRKEAR